MFWRKKKVKESITIVDVEDDKSDVIYYDYEDSFYKRAENIWRSIGFVNDRSGMMVAKIAGYLELYEALDKNNPIPYRPDLYNLLEINKSIEKDKNNAITT